MLLLVNQEEVPPVAPWVQLSGGKTLSHEQAFIKEMIEI